MKRKKLTKGLKATVIISALVFVAVVALIITNVFIPVKYLSAYTVVVNRKDDGNGARARGLRLR